MANNTNYLASALTDLPLDNLIGAPLVAAAAAQTELSASTVNFIYGVGLKNLNADIPNSTADWQPVYLEFSYASQGSAKDDSGAYTNISQIRVPLIAVVHIPSLSIKEVTIDFTMSIMGSATYGASSRSDGIYTSAAVGNGYVSRNNTFTGRVAAAAVNRRTSNQTATYNIKVKATDTGYPEGMSKILDVLEGTIS